MWLVSVMKIKDIASSDDPVAGISALLDDLHRNGPVRPELIENITYFKRFHSEAFRDQEGKIITALGLFYKNPEPDDLYSYLLSGIGRRNKEVYGEYLTPVQASVRKAVEEHQVVSISAPTSAGKSYSIRDFIAESDGDAVVVVPSRALIAEYVNSMKRRFGGDKGVMVSSFVDNVFRSRGLRRIFVLTPERARDLFSPNLDLNLKVFFFDEAQISEDGERGVVFDLLVRRVKKHFKSAKLIFAHPFVENPGAQVKKHNFDLGNAYSKSYPHGTVGKIFVYQHKNNNFYYFSPFADKGVQVKNSIEVGGDFRDFAFGGGHFVLVYVSKASLYNGSYIKPFLKYIDSYEYINSPDALRIINEIENLLGADGVEHNSQLVSLLRKGVVIHHGSVPLEVRFLVEDLIRGGYVKICFATSTLAQGVNMPFDIVWLNNMRVLGDDEQSKSLSFKNLIGRAGRLTKYPEFDFGYVFTENPHLLSQRIGQKFELKDQSVLDDPNSSDDPDVSELIQSIKDGTFDEDKQAPFSRVERLGELSVLVHCLSVLDTVYSKDSIKLSLYGGENKGNRELIKQGLKFIYQSSLGRELLEGELAVFEQAISIFLQVIQGRSFKEIVGVRYSRISKKEQGKQGVAEFSQPAAKLPQSTLKHKYPLFERNTLAKNVSYDAIVFDTYDYLDQVISFSLNDSFVAAFKVYKEKSGDGRADKFIELLKYGTNDSVAVLLIRYGFPPENVSEVAEYIQEVSEDMILFRPDIASAPLHIRDMVEWYLPN